MSSLCLLWGELNGIEVTIERGVSRRNLDGKQEVAWLLIQLSDTRSRYNGDLDQGIL